MHIWTLVLDDEQSIPTHILGGSKALLSENEQARADRFLRMEDSNRFVLAHAFCRLMLSHFGVYLPEEWKFEKEEKGRPYILPEMNSEGIDFNITHTKKGIACALAFNQRVGVDIEAKKRSVSLEVLIEKQFSSLEQSQFVCLSDEQRSELFFKIWTLKEAYIKVTGRGLSEPLKGFGFDLSGNRPLCYLESLDALGRASRRRLNSYYFGLVDAGNQHQLAWSIDLTKIDRGEQGLAIEPKITNYRLEDLHGLLTCG